LAFASSVLFRKTLVNCLMAMALLMTAVITVGLTASANSPFTISLQPAIMRLGIDLDVKLGTMHLHAGWSALPESTKPGSERF
jgi:hypothetical protein